MLFLLPCEEEYIRSYSDKCEIIGKNLEYSLHNIDSSPGASTIAGKMRKVPQHVRDMDSADDESALASPHSPVEEVFD